MSVAEVLNGTGALEDISYTGPCCGQRIYWDVCVCVGGGGLYITLHVYVVLNLWSYCAHVTSPFSPAATPGLHFSACGYAHSSATSVKRAILHTAI